MQSYSINNDILVKECILIDQDKQNLGKRSLSDAQKIANENELDLVLISDNPPVCRILDYQKFVYENKKKIKHQQKASKVESIKEIKFGANIQQHDLDIKIKKIKELLQQGHKVKVSCRIHRRLQALKPKVLNIFQYIYEESKASDMPPDFIKDSGDFIQGVIS